MAKDKKEITIIGTGKLAFQLADFLKDNLNFSVGFYGRNEEHSVAFASKLRIKRFLNFDEIPSDTLVIVSVSDSAVSEVIQQLPTSLKVAYTTGSIRLQDLPKRDNLGVFYPLQTFSKNRKIDLSIVPFLIEANHPTFEDELIVFAKNISNNVQLMSSEQRYHLHIAAVIANNFSNFLYHLSSQYLQQHQLDFDLLQPLLRETVDKLEILTPLEAQSGPASRGDKITIEKHLNSIKDEETKKIYQLISEQILCHFGGISLTKMNEI